MHERSVALAVLRQLDHIRESSGVRRFVRVTLELGELSGVEPSQFVEAFFELGTQEWLSGVELELRQTPLSAKCRSCGSMFPVESYTFLCPLCGSTSDLIDGDKITLVSVEAKVDADQSEDDNAAFLAPLNSR
ncbi:MAG: putative hydrogenase nickel incorporation protein HypA [Pirellulaceae bacterium]|nr:MAG: putative hydrogenase nickel incorporation protein HypA [Pirellulaceae bacterium]